MPSFDEIRALKPLLLRRVVTPARGLVRARHVDLACDQRTNAVFVLILALGLDAEPVRLLQQKLAHDEGARGAVARFLKRACRMVLGLARDLALIERLTVDGDRLHHTAPRPRLRL